MTFAKNLLVYFLGMIALGSIAVSATSYSVVATDARTGLRYPNLNSASSFFCDSETFLIDCLEANSVSVPYDSRSGTTPTEIAQIISGTVNQADQSFLDEMQIASGLFMIDVAYPTSNLVINFAVTMPVTSLASSITCGTNVPKLTLVDYKRQQPHHTMCCESSVLTCGEANSISMDYVSRVGNTLAETGKVLYGDVAFYDYLQMFTESQVNAGFILTDIAAPASDSIIIYNAVAML
jgi:ferredoxin